MRPDIFYEGLSVCPFVHMFVSISATRCVRIELLQPQRFPHLFHIFSVIFRGFAEMLMDRYRTNGQTDARTTDGRMDRQDASKTVENYCDCVLIHFGFVHLSAVQYDILRLSAERTDGQMDGWTDGQIDGRMDRQMDGQTDTTSYR